MYKIEIEGKGKIIRLTKVVDKLNNDQARYLFNLDTVALDVLVNQQLIDEYKIQLFECDKLIDSISFSEDLGKLYLVKP